MGIAEILTQIDREIAQLQRARMLLNGSNGHKGKKTAVGSIVAKKRNLTPEGRRRIAEAVRRRWERQRRAAAAK